MNYQSRWYQFTEHPDSDSCWSLSAGPDGRIYAAACAETVPGGVVKLVRYREDSDSLEYLFSLDEMVDDPYDSGRATQCKIHYSFAPSLSDGVLYMATHLSGPPIDQPAYSPWNSWHDQRRCFRGAALLAFDTSTDEVLWWDTIIPKEGCRCLLHDEDRALLYALSYPRDHLIQYDIRKREPRDLGRIGSINAQALFTDNSHRVWTTDDYGHWVRYDPEKDRIERSPNVLPHEEYQTGWHSVLYDVAASRDRDCIYATTWNGSPHLIRFWPDEGAWGQVEDLGRVTPAHDSTVPENFFIDHCGGLTFAADGNLYYAASSWSKRFPSIREVTSTFPDGESENNAVGIVWRLDPISLQREQVAVLDRPDATAHYVTRGAVDSSGDLFFGHVGPPPVGFFKIEMPADRKRPNAHLPLRMWG